jgi:hypothetical protein
MDEIVIYTRDISFLAVILLMGIKLLFWASVTKRNIELYFGSFFKLYDDIDLHASSSRSKRRFMRWSNLINFFWWVATLVFIVFFVILFLARRS